MGIAFVEIQLYGCELDYHIFFMRKLEVKWTTFARSDSHMNKAFIWGIAKENFESWQLCHNMLCG